jgi:LCP family protein required for cell wall assembly
MNEKTTVFEKVGGTRSGGPLWRTILILSVVLVLSLILLIFAVVVLYTPEVDDDPPFSTDVQNPDATGDIPAVSPSYTRRDGVYNFLLMGKDKVGMNTDVIMIVNFDTGAGKINIVQIPRDTFFDLGTGNYKINAMYAHNYNAAYRAGSKNPSKDALETLASQIEENFCISIDYYAMIDLKGFSNIVNAIGGVYIDVPFDMYYVDPEQNLTIDLKAGPQTLNGDEAEQFVRFRSGYVEGDLGRVNAQKLLLSALFEQVKNNISISTIAKLTDTALKNVTTDIGLDDAVFFAKQAFYADLSDINMMTMPGLYARRYGDSGAWYYVLYRESALSVVNTYLNVYNEDITPEIFDVNTVLTDDSSEHLSRIYHSEGNTDVHTADDPDVYIPLLPNKSNDTQTSAGAGADETDDGENEYVSENEDGSDTEQNDTDESEGEE